MDDVLGVKINYRYKVSEKTSHKYQDFKDCIEGTTNKTDGGGGKWWLFSLYGSYAWIPMV